MAVACDPQSLMDGAKCLQRCLSTSQLRAIDIWSLCQLVPQGTDPQTVANQAKCIANCINPGLYDAIKIDLITRIIGRSADAQSLSNISTCMDACIPPGHQESVHTWLLTQIAGVNQDPQYLAEQSKCLYGCIQGQMVDGSIIALLAALAGVSADPTTLSNSAYCLSFCLNHNQRRAILTRLLCNWAMSCAATLINGIVAYWRMEEAAGNRMDSVNGYHWTEVIPPVGNTPGIVGNAVRCLTGVRWLTQPDAAALRLTAGDFTITSWSTARLLAGEALDVIHSKRGVSLEWQQHWVLSGGQFLIRTHWTDALGIRTFDTGLRAEAFNAWLFLALRFTRATGLFEVRVNNDYYAMNATGPVLSANNALWIGSDSFGTFTVDVDEMGFWNRRLTNDELDCLYTNPEELPQLLAAGTGEGFVDEFGQQFVDESGNIFV